MSFKGIILMFLLYLNFVYFKDIFCMICIFNESWWELSNLFISNSMKIWLFWKKKIWLYYNFVCWKDIFEKKIYLIYIIWLIWRYFLLFYESLRDLNYFSSLLISFWICNYYWKEKYIYKIVIIKSSVDL